MTHFSHLLSGWLLLCMIPLGVSGQLISATVFPNPAPVGTPVTLSVAATQAIYLGSGCGLDDVRQGSPMGPVVYAPQICIAVLIPVGPGAPATVTWAGIGANGSPVPPGTYYVKISGNTQASFAVVPPVFIPVRIDAPGSSGGPVLSASGNAAPGSNLLLSLAQPSEPFAGYFLAASLTTNVGAPITPTQRLALDFDPLFALSFPTPNPQLFSGFQGSLDMNGHTSAPVVLVPAIPGLAGFPLALQAVVFGSAGIQVSNPLTFAIP